MIILKIILWALIALAALIVLILCLPVGIDLTLSDEHPKKFALRIAGLTFNLDGKQKEKSEKPKAKQQKREPFLTRLRSLLKLFKTAVGRLPWLFKKCKVRAFELTFTAADSDAADAALEYGLACGVIYPLTDWIAGTYHLSERNLKIAVNCDFDAAKPKYRLRLAADAYVIHLVAFALYVLLQSNREDDSNAK